ncbi:NAD(P)-binding domain-containing protein [Marinimicrobium sp. C2-29]|uniref:NAD(P)-binding domain-containing protein n=1 Tax=Marinimicrobium sp. C2-29 TaxID=3139825 RepID=UPI0031399FEC
MNTAGFEEQSLSAVDHGELAFEDKPFKGDPFGIKAAAMAAGKERHWTHSMTAKFVSAMLTVVGLLPFVLLAILPVLVVSGNSTSLINLLASVFFVWVIAFLAYQLRLISKKPHLMRPVEDRKPKSGTVVVIGAGPVGLAVVKECRELGIEVTCFESKPGVGGVYRYDENKPSGVWKSARLTSSPWVTAFSDFPPSNPSSIHHNHEQYVDYLEDYSDHFDLSSSIRFGCQVERVEPLGCGWRVSVRDLSTDSVEIMDCDNVSICTGTHQTPKPISLPGLEGFKGDVRHVSQYKGPEDFKDKKVVIAGLGESGADIAYELSKFSEKVTVSVKRGKFVIPRINPLTGKANDYDTNRIRNAAPIFLKNGFMSMRRRLCQYMGNHTPSSAVRAKLLQISNTGPNTQTATKSDDFIMAILEGKLDIERDIVRFEENGVVFSDGRRESADIVLFAHGYIPAFPFLELPGGKAAKHPSEMYLNMFDPDVGSRLAFCGFARPALGAIPPVGELQARLFSQVVSGRLMLPAIEEWKQHIECERRQNRERFPGLPEKNVVVSWIPYMDKLATLIGCRPDPWKLLASPVLLWRVLTGAVNGAHYRLHGVGSKPVAKDTVCYLKGEHDLREVLTMLGLHFWVWPLGLVQGNRRFQSDISNI